MRASIYTRKGDLGQTGLFSGKRVKKNDRVMEAIGTVDELNAQIGAAITQIKNKEAREKLDRVQRNLFVVGSGLAGYGEPKLGDEVDKMEEEIDRMWAGMPPLKNFILPRGQLHLARTVARRAERAVIVAKGKFAWQYLNRLSDYLFCLARWVNYKAKIRETVWKST